MRKEIDKKEKLKNWFLDLIDTFRAEYEKLTPAEQRYVPINQSYKKPCQIEVFWINEPFECQLIVYLHNPDRKDKEIIINGPFKKLNLKTELIKIMDEPRWNKEATYSEEKEEEIDYLEDINIGFQGKKYSDILIHPLYTLYRYFDKDSTFAEKFSMYGAGSIFGKDGWSQIIIGNISEFVDINSIVQPEMARVKNYESTFKNTHKSSGIGKSVKEIFSYGAYYYPLLRIGNEVELSFTKKFEIIIEEINFLPKKEFKFTIGSVDGFYDTFGFIALQLDETSRVVNILNTIFGVSCLLGYECLSIKESELVEISELPGMNHVFVSSWQMTDTKRPLQDTYYGKRRQQIELEQMSQILTITESVLNDENLTESIHLLLEGFTHFYNSEYSQSFLYSWFIIEKHIAQRFSELLIEKNITGERKKKFKTQDKWSSDTRIEVLSLNDKLSSKEYELISEYNTKRNRFVHKGESIGKDDAEIVLLLAKENVENKMNQFLEE